MHVKVVLTAICLSLAGCATMPSDGTACTNMISGVGSLLKFCQEANRLQVTESGVVGRVEQGDLTIVHDPKTLARLTRYLNPRAEFRESRRLIAHACVLKGEAYATIRVSDLSRIASTR